MDKQHKKQKTTSVKLRLERDELMSSLQTSLQISKEWEQQNKASHAEIDHVNDQLIEAIEDNKRLEAEKKRFVGVNEMLEQKIQVEKSEKMVLMSEVDHIDRHIGKLSIGTGKMS